MTKKKTVREVAHLSKVATLFCVALLTIAMALALAGCGDKVNPEDFEIEDGVLTAYTGMAKEVTVPETVEEIANIAFSWDFDHGVNLEKVTVPGTVKTIDKQAFSFTVADCIIIEEGVEEIGDDCFMDSYISEIHFPASLAKIGERIMETEEGLSGCKIYVPKGSKIAKYFEDDMPYGNAELIYE